MGVGAFLNFFFFICKVRACFLRSVKPVGLFLVIVTVVCAQVLYLCGHVKGKEVLLSLYSLAFNLSIYYTSTEGAPSNKSIRFSFFFFLFLFKFMRYEKCTVRYSNVHAPFCHSERCVWVSGTAVVDLRWLVLSLKVSSIFLVSLHLESYLGHVCRKKKWGPASTLHIHTPTHWAKSWCIFNTNFQISMPGNIDVAYSNNPRAAVAVLVLWWANSIDIDSI